MGVFTKKKVTGDDEDLFASAVVNLNDPTQVEKFRAVVNASKIREGGYWDWYDRLWAFAWEHFVDHQHGAAEATADTDRRDPAPGLSAPEHVQQVQHDTCAGSADRMADGYGAAIDVQPIVGNAPEGVITRAAQSHCVIAFDGVVVPKVVSEFLRLLYAGRLVGTPRGQHAQMLWGGSAQGDDVGGHAHAQLDAHGRSLFTNHANDWSRRRSIS